MSHKKHLFRIFISVVALLLALPLLPINIGVTAYAFSDSESDPGEDDESDDESPDEDDNPLDWDLLDEMEFWGYDDLADFLWDFYGIDIDGSHNLYGYYEDWGNCFSGDDSDGYVIINGNHAVCVARSIPATMFVGSSTTVSLTMRNYGTLTWTGNENYSLGSPNPQDNQSWEFERISVGDTPVHTDEQKTFTFTITAPATSGTYNFKWQMVQDENDWFGDASKVLITVLSYPITISAKGMTARNGETQNITATMGERVEFTLAAADKDSNLRAINFWVLTPSSTTWRNIRFDGSLNDGYVENTTTDTTVSSGANVATIGPVKRNFTMTLDEGFGTYQFKASSRDSREVSSAPAIINVQVENRAPGPSTLTASKTEICVGETVTLTATLEDADGNMDRHGIWWNRGIPNSGWVHPQVEWGEPPDATGWSNISTQNLIPSNPSKSFITANWKPISSGTYRFHCAGGDSAGGWGGGSEITIVVSDASAVSPPTGLTASNIGSTRFTLAWNPSANAVGYEVFLNGDSLGTTSNAMMEITGLTASTAYSMSVRAFNGAGDCSAQSNALGVNTNAAGTPVAPPTLPSGWPSDTLGSSNDDGLTNIAKYNLGAAPGSSHAGSSTLGNTVPEIMLQAGADGTYAVGSTVGEFAVDKNGAATYSIPIAVVPGTAGMQPSISLEYSSATGSGIAGYGWSLAGLSSIVRCGQSKLLDGKRRALDFSYEDRYVFDGQRLVAISGQDGQDGTEYRLESDNFTRIVSYNSAGQGPAWFKAWTKSGLIVELGNTSDSAQKIGNYSEIFSWQVNKISDTAGNYMEFKYVTDADSGQQVIDKINYTGNGSVLPYASVKFDYKDRPDVMSGYIKGAKVTANKRLSAVKVCYEEQPVRTYTLSYTQREHNQRSLLASVTETGKNGKSYRPIEFEYSNPDYGWDTTNRMLVPPVALGKVSFDTNSSVNNYVPDPNYNPGVAFIDLNGDGLVDCVQKTKSISRAWLNTGNGWVEANGANGQPDYRLPGGCELADGKTPPQDTMVRFVDLNQDGLVDVTSSSGVAYLNTGSGFVLSKKYSFNREFGKTPTFIDINGDGKLDLLLTSAWDYPSNSILQTWAFINNGGGDENVPGSAWAGSVGLANNGWYYGPNIVLPCPISDPGVRLIDINGDGLVDIVCVYYDRVNIASNNNKQKAWINTGTGFVESPAYGQPGSYVPPITVAFGWNTKKGVINYTGAEFVDLNGDGLPDIVSSSKETMGESSQAWINTGSGWIQDYGYAPPVSLTNVDSDGNIIPNGCAFMDINNDGLPDLVRSYGQNRGDGTRQAVWINTGSGWKQGTPAMIPPVWISLPKSGNAGTVLEDFNGDGVVDLAWRMVDVYAIGWLAVNKRVNPDKLIKATTSLGASVEIFYTPLTDVDPQTGEPTVYVKESGATFPKADIIAPMHVVEFVSNDDGCGGTYDIAYRYGGLRAENDIGMLGFSWMEVMDTRTGISTKTYFSQEYPTLGMTTDLVTTAPDGTVLNESTSMLAWRYGPNNKIRFAYASDIFQKTYELNGVLTSTTHTTYEYDSYGNATSVIVDTSDATGTYTKTSTSTYENWVSTPSSASSGGWMLGRLTRSSVTTQAPGVPAQTRTSAFEYHPATGLLTKEVIEPDAPDSGPLKLTTTYQHDTFGNKTKATTTGYGLGTAGRAVSTTYDGKGRFPVETKNAFDHIETYTYYEDIGVIESTTGPNGLTTMWEYDGFARPVRESRADGTETTTEYLWSTAAAAPGSTYLIKTHSSGSPPAITFYDYMGRAIANWTVNPGGYDGLPRVVVTETAYDNYGCAYAKSMPHYIDEPVANIHWAYTYAYDILNRPRAIATPDDDAPNGEVVSIMEYNGLVIRTTNPLGQVEEATKNTQGQIIKRVNNAGADAGSSQRGEVHYTYDAYGNLLKTSVLREDSTPVETTFVYDKRGRKISMTDPDMGTWTYSYNAAGELISQTDAKNQKTLMEYDALGRMTKRTDADNTVTIWTYDTAANGLGKIISIQVTAPNVANYSETFTYDNLGRPVAHTKVIDGTPYTTQQEYDDYNRPTVITYPNGFKVKNLYNTLGFLKEVRAAGGTNSSTGLYRDVLPNQLFWQADSYTVAGAIDGATHGNGLTYDAVVSAVSGRIKAITASVCDAAGGYHALNHIYEYDALGQVIRRFDQVAGRNERFTYDGLNRLVSYNINNSPATTVSYSALGNITYKSDIGAYSYSGFGPHAVASVSDASANITNYAYDANGNQTTSAGRELEWSPANQIKKITQGNISTTFRFGAARERIVQQHSNGTKTIYVGSAYEVVKHSDGLIEEKCHIFTPLGRTATRTARNDGKYETRYYHQDGLGSIVAVSDEYGRTETRFAFDPWGKRLSLLDLRDNNGGEITRGFTGHEHLDDFGLIHMNGRIFDPSLARFLSADSYVQNIWHSQYYNRYSYCVNRPLAFIDPSGEFFWVPVIIGAIIGAYSGGTLANHGEMNPTKWNYNSQTWRYMGYGAVVGAVAGYCGAYIATADIPMANTLGIAGASMINSMGTYAYTGGKTPISVSIGAASYNFTNGQWGYLGKKGNKWYANVGYGLGALANLADINQLINATQARLYTDDTDSISHSAIVEWDGSKDGNILMSFGPDDLKNPGTNLGYATYFRRSTTDFHYTPTLPVDITVNRYAIDIVRGLGKILPFQGMTTNCVNMSSLSLWLNGIPNIGIHPYLLYATTWAYSAGIRVDLFSYYLTTQQYDETAIRPKNPGVEIH